MTTPRQQLLSRLSIALAANAARRALYPNGRTMEFGGKSILIHFPSIELGTTEMNELVEGLAKGLGEKTWDYYLGLSDAGYNRLLQEAMRRS